MGNSTVATAVLAAATSVTLVACGGSATPPPPQTAAGARADTTVRVEARTRPQSVVENCATRSEADFPGAFDHPDNVVVGPLVLVGAAYTPPRTIREFGGDKIMALVRAGHRVTVALSRPARPGAGLGYGPLPEGVELKPQDGHRAVTFIACGPGEPSGSTVDGEQVTFWSGAILASSRRCVPLLVWVDDERAPYRAMVRMGVRRCA
jgi:hypothetical protein